MPSVTFDPIIEFCRFNPISPVLVIFAVSICFLAMMAMLVSILRASVPKSLSEGRKLLSKDLSGPKEYGSLDSQPRDMNRLEERKPLLVKVQREDSSLAACEHIQHATCSASMIGEATDEVDTVVAI